MLKNDFHTSSGLLPIKMRMHLLVVFLMDTKIVKCCSKAMLLYLFVALGQFESA